MRRLATLAIAQPKNVRDDAEDDVVIAVTLERETSMNKKSAAVVAVALLLTAGQAAAAQQTVAQLSGVVGDVIVTQGATAAHASNATTLVAGSRVMAGKSASAQIKYADGCTLNLAPGAMSVLAATSPCAASHQLVSSSKPMQASEANDWLVGIAVPVLIIGGFFAIKSVEDNNKTTKLRPVSP